MGEVYLRRIRGLNRTVALKILPPDVASDNADAALQTRAKWLHRLTSQIFLTIFEFADTESLHLLPVNTSMA